MQLPLPSHHSLFHSFCIRPSLKFENQESEEEVLMSLRAHPITLIPTVLNSIILSILALLLGLLFRPFLDSLQSIYLMVFFYFVVFVYLWFQLVNWYFNVGIITNKQIIDVDFNALSFRDDTRTELGHIEDITVKVSGFASSIFDYGNIFVQTAGSEINTEFIQVPHPTRASYIIQDILKIHGAIK